MIQVTNLSKMFPVASVYRYRGQLRMITGLSFGGGKMLLQKPWISKRLSVSLAD